MTDQPAPRPPIPPFDLEAAKKKVRMAEDAWNRQDPETVSMAYSPDTKWRNRSEFLNGRSEVVEFLKRKWAAEKPYRLIKEIWAYTDDKIAVRFCYEWQDSSGSWFRAHGNENWEFDPAGYMAVRHASINDVPIDETDCLFHWPIGTPRPDDHPGLSELGL